MTTPALLWMTTRTVRVMSLVVLTLLIANTRATALTFTPIDLPGAIYTQAYGINSSGQILGLYEDSSFTFHGFLFDNGAFTTIDVPGAIFTAAFGINASGRIVGTYST